MTREEAAAVLRQVLKELPEGGHTSPVDRPMCLISLHRRSMWQLSILNGH
jgi:hypothetical protein